MTQWNKGLCVKQTHILMHYQNMSLTFLPLSKMYAVFQQHNNMLVCTTRKLVTNVYNNYYLFTCVYLHYV